MSRKHKSLKEQWQDVLNLEEMGIYVDGQPHLAGSEEDPHYVEGDKLSQWLIDYGTGHVRHPHLHTALVWGKAIYRTAITLIGMAICGVFGHAWVSDDYAGPDSGYMGAHCSRCGESHGQRLY